MHCLFFPIAFDCVLACILIRGARALTHRYSFGAGARLQQAAKKYSGEKSHGDVTAGFATPYLQADRSRDDYEAGADLETVRYSTDRWSQYHEHS
jgi:hypothetical protein